MREARAAIVMAAVAALATLFLTSCGPASGSGDDDGEGSGEPQVPLSELSPPDPASLEGPSTATLSDRSVEPVVDDPKPELPVTVTFELSAGPTDVTVKDSSRIVAVDMAGSISATVWGLGLGDDLVGRDQAASFPGLKDVDIVTKGGHSINAEAVMKVRPTVIITDGSIGPRDVVEQLADTGVPVVVVPRASSVEGAAEQARAVGEALGVPEAGDRLGDRIVKETSEVQASIDEHLAPKDEAKKLRIAFLYIRGDSGVYYLFGEGTGADDLIERLGGVDVGSEQGWKEYTPLTDEAIVAADPDVLLVMTHGLESAGGVDGLLKEKTALSLTTAGQKRRIVDMADADVLSFGPRSSAVLDALARAIYAPAETS